MLTLACLLYVMDLTVLHLAVPTLSAKLQPTSAQLLWIVDIYGYMVAGFLITMGTLGDRIGRRRLLLIGAAAFSALSIMAAYAASAEQLIAARALLGIAGATLAPSTLSLIFAMFDDPRQRATAGAVWISAFSAGSAVGPALGGVLLEHFWWGSVFLLGLPVIGALLVLGPLVLPEYHDADAGRLDIGSVGLSLVAVLAVIFGCKQIAQDGIAAQEIVTIVAGVAVGVVFARRQLTLADPRGDPLVRLSRRDIAAAGVVRVPRVDGVVDGRPRLADGRVLEVGVVVWATGFVADFGWIRLPIFDAAGDPIHHRGVVDAAPGLYFLGLPFQHSPTSTHIGGVGKDARYIADHLAANRPPRRSTHTASRA